MAKKIYKRILIEENELSPGQWQRQYKKVLDEEAMAKAAAEEKAKAAAEEKAKAAAEAKKKAAPKKAPAKKAAPKKAPVKKAPAKKPSK